MISNKLKTKSEAAEKLREQFAYVTYLGCHTFFTSK